MGRNESQETEVEEGTVNGQFTSPMMKLRLRLYPYRRHLQWLRRLARLQMGFPINEKYQWRFCRWVSLLTTGPNEQLLWRMPGTSLNYMLDMVETIQMNLYYRSAFQPEITYWIERFLEPQFLIIDAGANVGIHSLTAGAYYREKLGKTAEPMVHAFEPNPSIFEQLQQNVRLNGLDDYINTYPSALSDRDEWTSFYLSSRDNSTSSSLASLGPGHLHTGETVRVQTTSLSAFIREHSNRRVGLIKLDIEGAELPALRGARELLLEDHPVIILEVYPDLMKAFGYSFLQTWEFLQSLGYEIQRILPNRALDHLKEGVWPTDIAFGDVLCLPHSNAT